MRVTYLNEQTSVGCEPAVLALGFFDGIHIGHMCLIEKAKEIARRDGLQLAVMTFYPHPKEVLGGQQFDYLMSLEAKIEKMERLGVERLYIVEFTKEFALQSPEQFVQQYIVNRQVKHVVAGFDYTYGHKGKGNMKEMKKQGDGCFGVTVLSKVEIDDRKISSTYIRELLREGKVDVVKRYLGAEYETAGTIISYRLFPKDPRYGLLDIMPNEENLLPKEGIYQIELTVSQMTETALAIVYQNEENKKEVTIKIENKHAEKLEGCPLIFKWLHLLESGEKISENAMSYS